MNLSKKPTLTLVLVLAVTASGCNSGDTPVGTQATAEVPTAAPAVTAEVGKKLPDIQDNPRQPLGLGGDSRYTQTFLAPPAIASVTQVGIVIGTYGGESDGKLVLEMCQGARCAVGDTELSKADDNASATITLSSPFEISAAEPLSISVSTLGASKPVALWGYDAPAGSQTSVELHDKLGNAPQPQANISFLFNLI